MKFVGGTLLKCRDEVKVKLSGVRTLRVNQETPTTNVVTHGEETGNGVYQQSCADSPSLVLGVNTESSEKRHWLRIATCSPF